MGKVKLTVLESRCRCDYCRAGDTFVVGDLCPPVCHELWSVMYPGVYTLLNGGELDQGDERARHFTARCPDGGRVVVYCEAMEETE